MKEFLLIPKQCPCCNSNLILDGEYLKCNNRDGCFKQICGRISIYLNVLNVKEWGDSLITKLVESGKVTTIADLYKLSVDDLASIDRMGKKSAQKCYDLLWKSSEVTLDIFLGGLSIPMIGSTTIRQIMSAGCDTLEKFGQLKAEHFAMVSGIGPNKAEALANGLIQNKQLIFDLLDNGVKIKDKVVGKLTGKRIAITGSTNMKRAELEKLIADNGGENKSSVNKSCTHLIIADVNSQSSKAVSARKMGVTLISEEDFLNLLN